MIIFLADSLDNFFFLQPRFFFCLISKKLEIELFSFFSVSIFNARVTVIPDNRDEREITWRGDEIASWFFPSI